MLGQPFSREAWLNFGHAVLFESADTDEAGQLLAHLAESLEIDFLHVSSSEVTPGLFEQLSGQIDNNPRIIYIEPGLWLHPDPEAASPEWAPHPELDPPQACALRQELATLLRNRLADHPVVLVTTVRSFQQMDQGLRCAGLFDRRVQVPGLPPLGMARVFIEEIGAVNLEGSVTGDPDRLGALLHFEYPDSRRRGLFRTAVQRLVWRERRPARYEDLVRFAVYGTADEDSSLDPPAVRYRHAVHEGGHALVATLGSRQQKPPIYCSVLKRGDSQGVMVQPYEIHEHQSDDLSYRDLLHSIRVLLAGRAAEHLLLGPQEVSGRGSTSDLGKASKLAYSMFAQWGLSPVAGTDEAAASNLVIAPDDYVDGVLRSEWKQMVQQFLKDQFLEVLDLLRQHQALLESIAEALTEKTFLLQGDFEVLLDQHTNPNQLKAA